MKIYVGNLSYNVTQDEVSAEFSRYGNVASTVVPFDRATGRPKGFAFVEMESRSEANAAITGLNGKMLNDRTMVVNEARPREDRRSGGYGNTGSGGYGRGGGRSGGGQRRRF